MAKRKQAPKLCRHKARNLGYATDPTTGKEIYFGPWGLASTQEAYQRWVSEFFAPDEVAHRPNPTATVADLVERYLLWAKKYYRKRASGKTSTEINCIRQALNELAPWFDTLCASFKPSDLIAVRSAACARKQRGQDGGSSGKPLKISTINAMIVRIRRMFARGVEWEIVPETVYRALMCVAHLSWRTAPHLEESTPVQPVDLDVVRQVFPHLNQKFRLMLRLHLFTGARLEEICSMRWSEIHPFRDGLSVYSPGEHKTAHHGIDKRIYIRDELITEMKALKGGLDHVFLSWCTGRSKSYRGPVQPSGYRQAIERAQKRLARSRDAAGLPPLPRWTLLQIRHTVATRIRQQHGIEGAQGAENDGAMAALLQFGDLAQERENIRVHADGTGGGIRIFFPHAAIVQGIFGNLCNFDYFCVA